MQIRLLLLFHLLYGCLGMEDAPAVKNQYQPSASVTRTHFENNTWQSFLQQLPVKQGIVVDYRGNRVPDQSKAFAIVDYDIGSSDLQQCADALMRLRAEFLFQQNRQNEIRFLFTDGRWFSWSDYCKGMRVAQRGQSISFVQRQPSAPTHANLRKYLDVVYTYAGTISLGKELKKAGKLEVGTIVLYSGSPGHCFIVVDEAINEKGTKVFKLVEGYTPAQSIYVLRNTEDGSPWHELKGGVIETASYRFENYQLKKFE